MTPIAPDPAPALSRRRELGSSSARSLLFTVLGEYVRPAGEPVWTGALVRVLGQLGVAEKAARQALARTAAEGWIEGRRYGRLAQWELTEAGRRLLTEGAARIYSFGPDAEGWDGRWLVLLAGAPEGGRDLRHQLRTRLTWAGFGALPGGIWVSPDTSRESEAAAILRDLGLDAGAMSFVAHYGGIGAQASIAARAWDLSAVEISYKEFIDTVEAMAPVTDEEVLTAQTLLVHEWRKFPFLDPRLPSSLLPPGWLGAQAAALFQARHAQWHDGAQRHWAVLARG
jgi:phenylacetic acid degradation operon negative regulatory protein